MSDETNKDGGTEPTPPSGMPDFAAPESAWPSLDPPGHGQEAPGTTPGRPSPVPLTPAWQQPNLPADGQAPSFGANASSHRPQSWTSTAGGTGQSWDARDSRGIAQPGAGRQNPPWGPTPSYGYTPPAAAGQTPYGPAGQPGPGTAGGAAMPAWGQQPAQMPSAPQYVETPDGGVVVAGQPIPKEPKPLVTYVTMVICAALWFVSLVAPQVAGALEMSPDLAFTQPWRLVTGGFVYTNVSLFSLVFALLMIWIMGRSLEPALGHLDFLLVYLLLIAAGSATLVLWCRVFDVYLIPTGASAVILGTFGLLITLLPRDQLRSMSGFWTILVINFLLVFMYPWIPWQQKLGGFLMGLAAGWLLRRRKNGRAVTTELWVLLVPIVLMLLVAALL
ncbi:rhomboid family intramembrane serine protease [Propionibacterium australiense]|uniref:Peptidase S54, rhomboid domain n=1 Tax=Propionibacterium australiense TaxID=119981 RepID=A0A383S2R4_9ACTN|nr:rhomboid family intramembrane serine protease [Propionibacterium australiense]RLP11456.1 rhomboid family intramembrane serine protease [Propionibacterium australiense]SYZ32153.1 Peptidase S54, rhomboid domain [Propionibacterium australiense]VEH90792.1 Rhomboid family [Propionibacterium australiense]